MVWLFFTYGLVEERGGRSREAGRRDLLFNRARIGSEDENDLLGDEKRTVIGT